MRNAREYDQLRKYGQGGDAGYEPPPGWESGASFSEGGFTGADSTDFSDFFESIFGAGARGGVSGNNVARASP